jgi:hypothetical protein
MALSLAIGAFGCGDGGTEGSNTSVDLHGIEPMGDKGLVAALGGAVDEDFIQSDNPMGAVSAALKVILANANVLNLFGAPQPVPYSLDLACYDVSVELMSVEFDFSDCDSYGLTGKAKVSKALLGPAVISFFDGFAIKHVGITGSMGLRRIANKGLTFNAFTADLSGKPGTPLVVENMNKGTASTFRFDGKIKISVFAPEILMWGLATSTVGDSTVTIHAGGTSEEDVKGNTPPEGAVTYPYIPFNCYCPTSGVISSSVNLVVTDVSFDLDNFTADNGIDDYPEFPIPVDLVATGTGTVTFEGCGSWTVQLDVDAENPIDVAVGIDKILEALESAKDAGAIQEPLYGTMHKIISQFEGVAPSFQVSIEDLLGTLTDKLLANNSLYVPFCAVQ